MDPQVRGFYVDGFGEDDRLRQRAHGVLERVRTQELLDRCTVAQAHRRGTHAVTGETWPEAGEVPYPAARAARVWVAADVNEGGFFRRRGYLEAARILINACDNRAGEQFLLPALGCYRQYFDLRLQELARAPATVTDPDREPGDAVCRRSLRDGSA